MNGPLFRTKTAALGLTQAQMAQLLGVSLRTIVAWASSPGPIPGPAEAYLNLLLSLPKVLQAVELMKVYEMTTDVTDGIYEFEFVGIDGSGTGVIVAQRGRLYGSDGGVAYDGRYQIVGPGNRLALEITCTVPPGVELVTGVPAQPSQYSFPIVLVVNARGETLETVQTPYGPVQVRVRFLRTIPPIAA